MKQSVYYFETVDSQLYSSVKRVYAGFRVNLYFQLIIAKRRIQPTPRRENDQISKISLRIQLYHLPFSEGRLAEKLDDIKRWYKNGLSNDEIDKLIVATDFRDNKEVTKLWKLMQEQFKD